MTLLQRTVKHSFMDDYHSLGGSIWDQFHKMGSSDMMEIFLEVCWGTGQENIGVQHMGITAPDTEIVLCGYHEL